MPGGSSPGTLLTTMSIAATLAAADPDALFPCPVCASNLKGSNLQEHLVTKHGITDRPGRVSSPRMVITGEARLLRLTFLAAFGAWSLVVSAGAVFRPNPTDVEMILLLVSFLAVFVPVVVSLLGLVRATVTLDDTSIVVRALGGAVRRDLTRPFRLTTGRLVERRSTVGIPVDSDSRGYDANAGTYLRLANESGSITIGSRAGGLGKRWAAGGWEKGGVLRTWDVTVDRRDVVAIEYFLAWCRQIRP